MHLDGDRRGPSQRAISVALVSEFETGSRAVAAEPPNDATSQRGPAPPLPGRAANEPSGATPSVRDAVPADASIALPEIASAEVAPLLSTDKTAVFVPPPPGPKPAAPPRPTAPESRIAPVQPVERIAARLNHRNVPDAAGAQAETRARPGVVASVDHTRHEPVAGAPPGGHPTRRTAGPEERIGAVEPSTFEAATAPNVVPADGKPVAERGPAIDQRLVADLKPGYPRLARRRGYEGRVLVRIDVLRTGLAGRVTLLRSSGHAVLDDAVLASLAKWRFIPARRAGVPTEGVIDIPVDFVLQ
ncbi:MAG: TonB family protein [Proteobacteria bacterium]|nr:TonB family protein [Pseudomonadota bacterium]